MAKYRRYRKYYRRRGGRWNSNIKRIKSQYAIAEGLTGDSITIAQNPGQNDQTVGQTFTVKNVEVG